MFGVYKNFRSKFQSSYEFYKLDFSKPMVASIRDDLRLIPMAIDLGFEVKEGGSFADDNRFEKEGVVIWEAVANNRCVWRRQDEQRNVSFGKLEDALKNEGNIIKDYSKEVIL